MYKLLTSSQQTFHVLLMYGFEESTVIRRQELTNKRQRKEPFLGE